MADKKRQLTGCAKQLFIRQGINSVTMDDVSGAAGISKKTTYQFFENKAALAEAVVDLLIEESKLIIVSNNKRAGDPVQELIFQQKIFQHWIALRFVFNPVMLKRFPGALKIFQDFKAEYLKSVIASNLSAGISAGYYRPDLNLPRTTAVYVSVVDHFIFDHPELHADVFEALHLFINGITTVRGRDLVERYKDEVYVYQP